MVCIFIALFQSNNSSKRCTIHATFTHSHTYSYMPCKVPTAHQAQFGVQYLAQGHFDMQLGGVGIRTIDLQITLYPLSHSRHRPSRAHIAWHRVKCRCTLPSALWLWFAGVAQLKSTNSYMKLLTTMCVEYFESWCLEIHFALESTNVWVPSSSIICERRQTFIRLISPKLCSWHQNNLDG